MKKFPYNFMLFMALVAGTVVSAQQSDKTYKEEFSTNPDVVIGVNTRHADVEIETWNKNKVVIEATIEVEGTDKEKAQRIIDNWNFKVLGNKKEVTINSRSEPRVFVGKYDPKIAPHIVISDMELPEVSIESLGILDSLDVVPPDAFDFPEPLVMPDFDAFKFSFDSVPFDYEKFKMDENYLKQWQEKMNKSLEKMNKQLENAKENLKPEDIEALKRNLREASEVRREYMQQRAEQHRELLKARREEAMEQAKLVRIEAMEERKRALEERRREMNEERKAIQEAKNAQIAKYEQLKAAGKQKEAAKYQREIIDRQREEMDRQRVEVYEFLEDRDDIKIKRVIRIKAPKNAKFTMNVRYGSVSFPD
ncbi:MAG: hypothetical protein KDC69_10030 [Flavobacteriaceae bacterium]|nr:hypothetical protein [Flavobacteriaceae bacterium]